MPQLQQEQNIKHESPLASTHQSNKEFELSYRTTPLQMIEHSVLLNIILSGQIVATRGAWMYHQHAAARCYMFGLIFGVHSTSNALPMPPFASQQATAMCPAAMLPVEVVLVHVGEAQRRVSQLLNHRLRVFGIQHLIQHCYSRQHLHSYTQLLMAQARLTNIKVWITSMKWHRTTVYVSNWPPPYM